MLSPFDLIFFMVMALFTLGAVSFVTGILILAVRASGKDVKALVAQTSQLAQKGLAEDVAGLVGNASGLLDAMNQLVKTTAGVGVFLTILGVILMGLASWIALKMYQVR
jgi:hypothetical protein